MVKLYASITPITFYKYFPTTSNRLPFFFESKEITNKEVMTVIPFQVICVHVKLQ